MLSQGAVRLNEKFIDLMEQLSGIMLKQGEPFRARAYQKAQETIMSYPADILSPADLNDKPGIGQTIMDKLNEYTATGTLSILEKEKNNPVNILAEIYGVGPKKAKELVEQGISSIPQLRENQHMLNDIQKVGLQHYEDVLKRIPRSEIDEYRSIFDNVFKGLSSLQSQFEIVGSYRRGAENSGDIDMIITSNTHQVFVRFIDELIKKNLILNVLSRGPTKCLVMAKIPSSTSVRRVDFLYTSLEEYPFSVLYFTGSKIFNTCMRHIALEKGFTMNEHGLYKMVDKKKGEKVEYIFHNEKDIFDFLGLEYKAPNERTDGRAIIKTSYVEPCATIPPKKVKKTLKKKPVLGPPLKKKILIIESDSEDEDNKEEPLMNYVAEFKKKGISVLDKLSESQLSSIIMDAIKAYHNEEPFMLDNQFDIIKEYTEKKYPSNQVFQQIGAPLDASSSSRKVTLPYHMGSMDKIKPDTNILSNWMTKYSGPYVLSCKLDGVSGLYTTEGPVPKLYTRGDGKVGQDISHLIPYLRLPKAKGIVIRGEFIIPKATFETKYKSTFANPRNMVAGIINHKTLNESVVKDMHFVSYEVIKPILPSLEQMNFLSTMDIEVVLNRSVVTSLTNEMLSQTLISWRQNYSYEIDGVIVANNGVYERKLGNPDHAFAFKMILSEQLAEAKVVDVLWSPSKDGYLKPRVQIEPIQLGGVCIEYATGFNGAFIHDNKIGIGAVIELIRSGDVIPHIRSVTTPALEAKMPDVAYIWNDTHVDIMLENMENDQVVKEKNITGFFKGLNVEGLSSGNVARIIQKGYDSVAKIIKMTMPDFLQVEGFKEKMASKLYNGIREKVEAASLVSIMAASNMFGRGFSEKRLELIMSVYPNILLENDSNSAKITKIAEIKGMATKTSEAFVERIEEFVHFIQEAGLYNKLTMNVVLPQVAADNTHPLFGRTIVMTGFRDSEIIENMKKVGAKLGSSISKNTFMVIVKEQIENGKTLDAKKLGIPIISAAEFKQQYFA
jgi:DNA ligase (NAD+)